ncbi:MAG TPA: hypothetical protein VFP56_06810 [Candidatus Limnocylindrales bacterium]|nr:hypothetical protein [Candidatus Limnocylindrales bacterium]
MDTRRSPGPLDGAAEPMAVAVEHEVEILELSALARPRRVPVGRVAFFFLIVLLAGAVAMVGMPSRSSFAFDQPLPNIFATTQTE